MKVISLDSNRLAALCSELLEKAATDNFRPDLILGIRTGGAELGRVIHSVTPYPCSCLECSTLRPATARKKRMPAALFRHLPIFLLDWMRILEAKLSFSYKSRIKIESVCLPDNLNSYKKILIVDDAVDSGATLHTVIEAVKHAAPDAEICSAAITVTSENPVKMPDYFIFHNSTLIRFSWSMDAKMK